MNTLQKPNNEIFDIAENLKGKVINWKNLTLDIVKNLYQAKKIYSNSGFRSDKYAEIGTTSRQNDAKLDTFNNFCDYIGLNIRTVQRYLERFEPEKNILLTPEQLKEKKEIAYQAKLTETQKKNSLIQKRINNNGEIPIGWVNEYETDYQKKLKEHKERLERIEQAKQREKEYLEKQKEIENQKKQDEKINDEKSDLFFEAFNAFEKSIEKQQKFKEKFQSTIHNQDEFLLGLDEILSGLDSDSLRLEFLHNIIKYCKVRINEFQVKSIKE